MPCSEKPLPCSQVFRESPAFHYDLLLAAAWRPDLCHVCEVLGFRVQDLGFRVPEAVWTGRMRSAFAGAFVQGAGPTCFAEPPISLCSSIMGSIINIDQEAPQSLKP